MGFPVDCHLRECIMAYSLLTETGSARRAYSQVLFWKTVKVKHETVEIEPRKSIKEFALESSTYWAQWDPFGSGS